MQEHDVKLLKENNYNVGKYLIALNACDNKGINFFEHYKEKLNKCEEEIKVIQELINIWQTAKNPKREQIVKNFLHTQDKETQSWINDEKKAVSGLSKIIHTLTDIEADPKHLSGTNLTTNVLEEIGKHNSNIELFEETMNGSNYDINEEMLEYEKLLKEQIEDLLEEELKLQTSIEAMEDRKDWVSKTFNIPMKEINQIINQYSRNE